MVSPHAAGTGSWSHPRSLLVQSTRVRLPGTKDEARVELGWRPSDDPVVLFGWGLSLSVVLFACDLPPRPVKFCGDKILSQGKVLGFLWAVDAGYVSSPSNNFNQTQV